MQKGDVYIGVEIDPLEVMSAAMVVGIIAKSEMWPVFDTQHTHATFPVFLLTHLECRVDANGQRYTATVRKWWLAAGHMHASENVAVTAERMKKFLAVIETLQKKESHEIGVVYARNA